MVSSLILSSANAQDLIFLKDGSEVKAKVVEINGSEIKYKKFENISGPTYAVFTKDTFCIKYNMIEDGADFIFIDELAYEQNNFRTRFPSNVIKCKVVEISTSEIKYKKFENLSGPNYSIEIENQVFMIRYPDGHKEFFNQNGDKNQNDDKKISDFVDFKVLRDVKVYPYANAWSQSMGVIGAGRIVKAKPGIVSGYWRELDNGGFVNSSDLSRIF
jgi:hypothetical protein